MEKFVEVLAKANPDVRDIFIRQIIMVPHEGHLVLYDAGDVVMIANVIAVSAVKWSHPVDFNPSEA